MRPGRARASAKRGRSSGGLLASLLAVVVLFAALLPFLFSRSPAAEPPAEVAAAARLAQSTAVELEALPASSGLLSPPPGESSFTFKDPVVSATAEAPASRLSREWQVDSLRFDPSSGQWFDAPSGSPRDAVRLTIRIRRRDSTPRDAVLSRPEVEEPVLARLVIYRALVEARP